MEAVEAELRLGSQQENTHVRKGGKLIYKICTPELKSGNIFETQANIFNIASVAFKTEFFIIKVQIVKGKGH